MMDAVVKVCVCGRVREVLNDPWAKVAVVYIYIYIYIYLYVFYPYIYIYFLITLMMLKAWAVLKRFA